MIHFEFQKLRIYLLNLPRFSKIVVSISVDIFLCTITVWLAFFLRIGQMNMQDYSIFFAVTISIFLALPVFLLSGLYRTIFRYSGWPAMLAVSKSIFIYGSLYTFIMSFIGIDGVPRTIGIIQPLLLFFSVGASRSFVAYWLGDMYKLRLKSSDPKSINIWCWKSW